MLRSKGLEFTKHRALHSAFGVEFARTRLLPEKFHRIFLDAYEARLEADYRAATGVDTETASQLVNDAREFINAAAQYLGLQ